MKKIRLRQLTKIDLPTVLTWRNMPAVRANMYTKHEITLAEHIKWFENLTGDASKQYFICEVNEKPCGVIGFSEINKTPGQACWAFYSSADAPRGIGALMEYAALLYIFDHLNLHKLRCEVLAFNKSVIKLHQKFGFMIEGRIRKAHFDGQHYHDILHLGIFSQEWAALGNLMKEKLKVDEVIFG
ncbi:MAG: UDP-4-amino-4,6-dideoxy-N-acetyl-beta-L-altrosamine N-acetyltransferase [Enterovibrio sp.]